MFMEGVSYPPFCLIIILFSLNRSLDILVGYIPMDLKFKYKWAQMLALEKYYHFLLFYSRLCILDFTPC